MSHNHHLFCQRYCLLGLAAWVGLTTLARVGSAGMIHLADLNAQVNIDTLAGGISGGTLDSQHYVNTQALFYRIGATGPQMTWLYSSSSAFSTGDGPENNVAVVKYTGVSGLKLTQIYSLVGSEFGSGSADISEQFQITNSGLSPLDLHLFQYNNLQISSGADTLQFKSPSQIYQTSSGQRTAEIVVTGMPAAYEVVTDSTLWDKLNNGSSAVLNNTSGPVTGNTASAMEWDLVQLNAGKSYTFSEDYALNIPDPVPEPSTMSLLFVALVVCACATCAICRRKGIRGTARGLFVS